MGQLAVNHVSEGIVIRKTPVVFFFFLTATLWSDFGSYYSRVNDSLSIFSGVRVVFERAYKYFRVDPDPPAPQASFKRYTTSLLREQAGFLVSTFHSIMRGRGTLPPTKKNG